MNWKPSKRNVFKMFNNQRKLKTRGLCDFTFWNIHDVMWKQSTPGLKSAFYSQSALYPRSAVFVLHWPTKYTKICKKDGVVLLIARFTVETHKWNKSINHFNRKMRFSTHACAKIVQFDCFSRARTKQFFMLNLVEQYYITQTRQLWVWTILVLPNIFLVLQISSNLQVKLL